MKIMQHRTRQQVINDIDMLIIDHGGDGVVDSYAAAVAITDRFVNPPVEYVVVDMQEVKAAIHRKPKTEWLVSESAASWANGFLFGVIATSLLFLYAMS
jgi:hypothetical protein